MKHANRQPRVRPGQRGTPAYAEGTIQAYLQARDAIRRSKLSSLFVSGSRRPCIVCASDTGRDSA